MPKRLGGRKPPKPRVKHPAARPAQLVKSHQQFRTHITEGRGKMYGLGSEGANFFENGTPFWRAKPNTKNHKLSRYYQQRKTSR